MLHIGSLEPAEARFLYDELNIKHTLIKYKSKNILINEAPAFKILLSIVRISIEIKCRK